jgi:hypothetical protein
MRDLQSTKTATGDNLDRLLALLDVARAEETRRRLVDLRSGCRALLAAIEREELLGQAA